MITLLCALVDVHLADVVLTQGACQGHNDLSTRLGLILQGLRMMCSFLATTTTIKCMYLSVLLLTVFFFFVSIRKPLSRPRACCAYLHPDYVFSNGFVACTVPHLPGVFLFRFHLHQVLIALLQVFCFGYDLVKRGVVVAVQ